MSLRGSRAAVGIQKALARQLLQLSNGIGDPHGHVIEGGLHRGRCLATRDESVDSLGLTLN